MDPLLAMADAQTQRLVLVALGMAFFLGLGFFGGMRLTLARFGRKPLGQRGRLFWQASLVPVGLIGLALFDASFIEADWLQVETVEVFTDRLPAGERLRIVHLTDLHVDSASEAIAALPDRVNALKPDLVILTGDDINSLEGLPIFRRTLEAIEAPRGRYAVQGNHDVWYWSETDRYGGGVATELAWEPVPVPETPLVLCGAPYGLAGRLSDCLQKAPEDALVLLAYHTADLIEDLGPRRPDLYLAGHTHGGQVRLPFYGALITLSKHDKKYEAGAYEVEGTTLVVNRGVGFEPNAPRLRFLCRPEIRVIDLVGEGR